MDNRAGSQGEENNIQEIFDNYGLSSMKCGSVWNVTTPVNYYPVGHVLLALAKDVRRVYATCTEFVLCLNASVVLCFYFSAHFSILPYTVMLKAADFLGITTAMESIETAAAAGRKYD